MAQPKKNIARLALQGISILGILLGFSFFLGAIAMIFSFQKDNLTELCFSLFILLWMLVLGAFLMYPSYKMLRGRSFEVIKSISAFLALTSFGFIVPFTENITNSVTREMSIATKTIVDLASFLLLVLFSVLVYKISMKLLERLRVAAYSPEEISETQNSTDKQ